MTREALELVRRLVGDTENNRFTDAEIHDAFVASMKDPDGCAIVAAYRLLSNETAPDHLQGMVDAWDKAHVDGRWDKSRQNAPVRPGIDRPFILGDEISGTSFNLERPTLPAGLAWSHIPGNDVYRVEKDLAPIGG